MTKKTNSEGKTLEEANNINKSLMVLGEGPMWYWIYLFLLFCFVRILSWFNERAENGHNCIVRLDVIYE